jgi:adenylosuccinate synthase
VNEIYEYTLIGLVNSRCTGLIGSGLVVHIPSFFAELDALEAQGKCSTILSFLFVIEVIYRA